MMHLFSQAAAMQVQRKPSWVSYHIISQARACLLKEGAAQEHAYYPTSAERATSAWCQLSMQLAWSVLSRLITTISSARHTH